MKFGLKKRETSRCRMRLDIEHCLGVAIVHECDGQTDGQNRR